MAVKKIKPYVNVSSGTTLDEDEQLEVTIVVSRRVLSDLAELIDTDYDLPDDFQTVFAKAVKGYVFPNEEEKY